MKRLILSICLFTSFATANAGQENKLLKVFSEVAERLGQDTLIKPLPKAEGLVDINNFAPEVDPERKREFGKTSGAYG